MIVEPSSGFAHNEQELAWEEALPTLTVIFILPQSPLTREELPAQTTAYVIL